MVVDALILTGFSSSYSLDNPNVIPPVTLLPADQVDPARFGSLPAGYLMFSNVSDFDFLFYWPGGSDNALEKQDFDTRGTISEEEAGTVPSTFPITAYDGPVYVVTGQHDVVFCNSQGTPRDQIDCGTSTNGFLADTAKLYPASDFEAYVVPNSGHVWQFHFAAPAAFGVVHDWIGRQGF